MKDLVGEKILIAFLHKELGCERDRDEKKEKEKLIERLKGMDDGRGNSCRIYLGVLLAV